MRAGLRTADVSARFGGEELMVLLPDTDIARAAAVAERLRHDVGRMRLVTERGCLQLSASFGVAAVDGAQPDSSLEILLARADEACYTAKRYGRDRVVVWAEAAAVPADDQH